MQIAAKPFRCVPLTLCKTLPCPGCLCGLGSAGLSACPGQTPSGFLLSVPAVSFDWGIPYKRFFSFSGNVIVFLQVFLLHWMNFFFFFKNSVHHFFSSGSLFLAEMKNHNTL